MTDPVALSARRARARALYAEGWSQRQIGEQLGIARSTACDDLNGRYRDRYSAPGATAELEPLI